MKKRKVENRRRSSAEMARDKRVMATLYLAGSHQIEIAQELKIDQSVVSRTLKTLHQQWIDEAKSDHEKKLALELAKINNLEIEYWRSWEDSWKGKTKELGDPRYLQGVQWCIDKRCKLFGLDAPIKANVAVSSFSLNSVGIHQAMTELKQWENDIKVIEGEVIEVDEQ